MEANGKQNEKQFGQSVAHYTLRCKEWALRGCVSTKRSQRQTSYYTLCPTANENENQGGNHNIIFSMSHGKVP